MDDLDSIFANLKLSSDDSSDGEDADKYFIDIDAALKKNETTSKWIDEQAKEYGPLTDEELQKLLDKLKNDDATLKEDACALRYSIVEIIAKRCLQVAIKIRLNELEEASKDAVAVVKFINEHKAYYAEKEYMVGFRYVANCLAIQGHVKDIQKKNDSKEVDVSRLKQLLQKVNEFEDFGKHQQVGVLAIKQYFAGNLRKGSCHDFQIRILRDVSVKENYHMAPTALNTFSLSS